MTRRLEGRDAADGFAGRPADLSGAVRHATSSAGTICSGRAGRRGFAARAAATTGHGAAGAPVDECAACGKQHSLLAGTIFEQTKTGLARWFLAIFLVTSSKGGISAMELQRQMGFGSYQTAWTWLHKIRKAMVRPDRAPLARAGRGRRDLSRRRQARPRRAAAPPARPRSPARSRAAAARPEGAAWAGSAGRRARCLGQEPRRLPRPERRPAGGRGHRRLVRLRRPRRRRLRPRAGQPQPLLGRRGAAPARHPPGLRPRQALAARHPPRRRRPTSTCRPISTSSSSASTAAPPRASATASPASSSTPSRSRPPPTAPSSPTPEAHG